MKTGAIAFLDALGFKGIWERHPPHGILSNLKRLAFAANTMVDQLNAFPGFLSVHHEVRFFSDTAVIAATSATRWDRFPDEFKDLREDVEPEVRVFSDLLALHDVCLVAALMTGEAPCYSPPLIFRGAIAFGEFEIDGQFVIGPAVDDAAEGEKRADAALVWLLPSARAVIRPPDAINLLPREILARCCSELPLVWDYPVPIKAGDHVISHVVNPLAKVLDTDRVIASILREITAQFQEKHRNTAAFLSEARTKIRDR